ncbi:MAG TPA: hypothetical protein VGR77_01455 [Candidatus Dormibacteraeota bacterium]|nr:hypothetical protein [Candidatus Dormibacteraeota bacterium]
MSSLDSEKTNFGLRFEPPDQGLCEGNGFVLEPVNSAYTIYRTNGKPIAGPFNVNDLFHRDGLAFTSDPRCYYDPTTNTWFAIILFLADDGLTSTIDISVNTSGDPTTAWTTYRIDTTHANAPATSQCPCFGDQPRLGIDAFNLYLSTDEFSISGTAFNGAQLYAVSKKDLVGLKRHIHFAHFDNPTINGDGNSLFAIEPATTIGSAPAEYFLNALDLNLDGSIANHIGVWAMTNREDVAKGEAPTLSSFVISSEPYSLPPPALQKGSKKPLDSGDDRMQQVQFINGKLWGELDTALTIPGDSTPRAAAAWFSVTPTLNDEETLSATMTRQGYVASRGNYVLYPALQADRAGNVAMVVSISGRDRFASAAYTTMRSGQSAFGPVIVVARGTGPYTPKVKQFGRWGDYSYAQLDPATDTFWLATEYVPPLSSQTTNRIRNWGTEVLQVKVGGEGNQN